MLAALAFLLPTGQSRAEPREVAEEEEAEAESQPEAEEEGVAGEPVV